MEILYAEAEVTTMTKLCRTIQSNSINNSNYKALFQYFATAISVSVMAHDLTRLCITFSIESAIFFIALPLIVSRNFFNFSRRLLSLSKS